MKNIYLVIVILFSYTFVNAQSIKLIKDINSGAGNSSPIILATMNDGTILFKATTKSDGTELWRSDGTTNGTVLVKDIWSGDKSGMERNPTIFVNNKLYFIGNDGIHGEEIWVTDGTEKGTKMIKDANKGIGNGIYKATTMVYLNGEIYYAGETDNQGIELWKTDGTEKGTSIIKDVNNGAGSSFSKYFIIAFGKVYFVANDGIHGVELWSTDGTEKGTSMVQDLNPTGSSNISDRLTLYNNNLYFSAKASDAIGYELYSSDGKSVSIIKDINTDNATSSKPNRMMVANNKLYFSAEEKTTGKELWQTDGTEKGTALLKNISPGIFNSDPSPYVVLNGKLIFKANNGTNGEELWSTDGTENGTNLLKDINPNAADGYISVLSQTFNYINYSNSPLVFNDVFYFCGDDGVNGKELWQTDGTLTGTKMVESVGNKPNKSVSSELNWIYVEKNNIWLSMSDGLTGAELYKYNIPSTTGIKHPNSINLNTKVYPNPNSGSFTIETKANTFKNGFLQIQNIVGQIIHSQTLSSYATQHSVTMTNMALGTYTVYIQLDNQTVIKKVIIK